MAKEHLHETKQQDKEWLNLEQAKIAKLLKKLRFRRKLFGGVSEQDVWKKIAELNTMYEFALTAERIRYDTLIQDYKNEHSRAGSMDEFNTDIGNITYGFSDKSQTCTETREKVGNE